MFKKNRADLVLITSVLWLGFSIQAFATENKICKSVASIPIEYKNMVEFRGKAKNEFASSKLIAKKADETLSSLLKAKSKILMRWMSTQNLKEASEAQIIIRWREYYADNFILGQYPLKEDAINRGVENLIEGVYKKHITEVQKKRYLRLFNEAKAQSLKLIENWPSDKSALEEIKSRVSKIELIWLDQLRHSTFKGRALEVLSWGVAYDPVVNKINMGLEALAYGNEATIFSVFAHEIGHSFDPCRWGAFFKSKTIFLEINRCLRSPQSAGAKKRDDSKLELFAKSNPQAGQIAAGLKLNPTCNKLQYPPIGMQADQLPETFADWFSAEVVSKSQYINTGLRSDLCNTKKLIPGSSYLSNRERLERIYLAQPEIGKQLKGSSSFRYCKISSEK